MNLGDTLLNILLLFLLKSSPFFLFLFVVVVFFFSVSFDCKIQKWTVLNLKVSIVSLVTSRCDMSKEHLLMARQWL